jgi:hypothetical protein
MKETILIAIIFVFIYLFLFYNKRNVVLVKGRDNNKYLVYNDKQKNESAILLNDIIDNMFKLRDYLYENKSDYPEYEKYIILLNNNLNKDRSIIYENDPNSNLTSFSVNKGEEIAFCLKSKKNGKLHKLNLLMYVAIHEMGHLACPEIGHTELFIKIFKFLTEVAIEIGVYKLVDYHQNPVEYCGMILSNSVV